ncbi:MAG: crotonase/enoyl-CoA hydratase family protein [Myxococcota bacterium]
MTLKKEGKVACVELTKLAMNPQFFDELKSVFDEISADRDTGSVLLYSSGKAFSYGLDLAAAFAQYGELFRGGLSGTRSDLLALIRRLQAALCAVAECPVPVVSAIHGWCIGGGVDLISAADIRYASADAKFSLRETKVAIVADLGSLQRLPPIIGQGATRELAFTGKDIDAKKALAIGLLNEVFDDRDGLMAAARKTAGEIAANPPLVVRGVKSVLNFGEGKPIREGLEYVAAWNSAFLASEDLAEALSAFLEKRTPDFKGR